jgi:4-amino-4-deoxy-L-arabinose transferase-like glycosyltransferase
VSRLLRYDVALVFVLILATFCWRLDDAPLAYTESHRAITAHQMVESGSWIVPCIWGHPYLTKPPLHYWTLAAAELVTGQASEWVWRLPSVLAAGALAALLCLVTNRWFGRPAGLIAGLSYFGLIALWSQTFKADIDSLHTLAVVGTALGLIELTRGRRGVRPWLTLATGLAFGAALLLKGPAGLPIVIGAMLGPALACRTWRPLRSIAAWSSLALGAVMFIAWVLAVRAELDGSGSGDATRGVREVMSNLRSFDRETILGAIALPAIVAVIGLPWTLLAPLALRRSTHPVLLPGSDRIVRGLLGTIVVALLIGVLSRIDTPRYMYIVLPLLCPLTGAVGAAWVRGGYGASMRRFLRQVLTVFAIALCGIYIGLVVLLQERFDAARAVDVALAGVSVLLGAWTVIELIRRHPLRGAWGIVALLALLTQPFIALEIADRRATSSYEAALVLRDIVGPKAEVIADKWIMNGPELFFYAGVDVVYDRNLLKHPQHFDHDCWIVFHTDEWDAWETEMGEHLDSRIVLPTRNRNAILARYRAP